MASNDCKHHDDDDNYAESESASDDDVSDVNSDVLPRKDKTLEGDKQQTILEANLLMMSKSPEIVYDGTKQESVSSHFKPTTIDDLCTCTYQTIMRGHTGICGKKSIFTNRLGHDAAYIRDFASGTLHNYVYVISNDLAPIRYDSKEIKARLDFIESLTDTESVQISVPILNHVLGILPLVTLITQYIADIAQVCAETWFQALPIRGARWVADYAFKYETKNGTPICHNTRSSQTFRNEALVILKQNVHLVSVMKKCLAINFDLMRRHYDVAHPPCHPEKQYDRLMNEYEQVQHAYNRHPSESSDTDREDRLVADAIRKEMSRVHEGLDAYNHRIESLVPEIRKWQIIQATAPSIYLWRLKMLRRTNVLEHVNKKTY